MDREEGEIDDVVDQQEGYGEIIIVNHVPSKQRKQVSNKKPPNPKVFEMKSSNYKTKVCDHYMKGSCKNGEKCPFIHPENVQLPECKYFLAGNCMKQNCEYPHTRQVKFTPQYYNPQPQMSLLIDLAPPEQKNSKQDFSPITDIEFSPILEYEEFEPIELNLDWRQEDFQLQLRPSLITFIMNQ